MYFTCSGEDWLYLKVALSVVIEMETSSWRRSNLLQPNDKAVRAAAMFEGAALMGFWEIRLFAEHSEAEILPVVQLCPCQVSFKMVTKIFPGAV